MDPFVLVEWETGRPAIWTPATIGFVWRVDELRNPDDTSDGESERELYERGWRWCQCFSVLAPDGEEGFLGAYNLAPLWPAEFDAARAALEASGAQFREAVAVLVDRATRRWP